MLWFVENATSHWNSVTHNSSFFSASAHPRDYSVEGFIMDEWCINNEVLLDNPDVVTLEGPEQHSVHW